MRKLLLTVFVFFSLVSLTAADNGLITVKSAYDVNITADRLENILIKKGMTVFIRIDHAEGAKKVGKELRPTVVVIFGNPNVGTPLMQCAPTFAIDLPQKMLIWQDENGEVWLTYNDPQYLADRHGITDCGAKVIKKVGTVLHNFAKAATQP